MQNKEMVDSPTDWTELWAIVGESLLSGVHHALNNRVAALSAISQVLRSGFPDATPLVASLASEVRQLEETVALLSLLRRARTRRPEPVQVHELIGTLPPLLAQHNDLKEITFTAVSADVLPVWAERDQLTRVLLTLAVAVGLEAERSGCRRVTIAYRGDDEAVTIRFACDRNGAGTGPAEAAVRRLDARAAAEGVAPLGGRLEVKTCPGGELAYELRLPTLLAARKAAGME